MHLRRIAIFLCLFTITTGCPQGSTFIDGGTELPNRNDAGTDGGEQHDAGLTPCQQVGLTARPFVESPTGVRRADLAADFELPLLNESAFSLKQHFTGCESYVFIPDSLPAWKQSVTELLSDVPANTHLVFISTALDAGTTHTQMRSRLDAALPGIASTVAARTHVANVSAPLLNNWLGTMLTTGLGRNGFLIDPTQRIRALGSLVGPDGGSSLSAIVNDARWANALAEREDDASRDDATILTVLAEMPVQGPTDASVFFPDAGAMALVDSMFIDVEVRCPDAGVLENESCSNGHHPVRLSLDTPAGPVELMRASLPFAREATWRVDASPFLPFLSSGGARTLQWATDTSATTSVFIRLRSSGAAEHRTSTTHLFSGGTLDSTYNAAHADVTTLIPANVKRVELAVLVTGHGLEANNCAEQCAHSHVFTVNGSEHELSFPRAGSVDGCVNQVAVGTVPNQFGPWWTGRAGWCPGQPIRPRVIDITEEVTKGMNATIGYRVLINGTAPSQPSGTVELNAWLVLWE